MSKRVQAIHGSSLKRFKILSYYGLKYGYKITLDTNSSHYYSRDIQPLSEQTKEHYQEWRQAVRNALAMPGKPVDTPPLLVPLSKFRNESTAPAGYRYVVETKIPRSATPISLPPMVGSSFDLSKHDEYIRSHSFVWQKTKVPGNNSPPCVLVTVERKRLTGAYLAHSSHTRYTAQIRMFGKTADKAYSSGINDEYLISDSVRSTSRLSDLGISTHPDPLLFECVRGWLEQHESYAEPVPATGLPIPPGAVLLHPDPLVVYDLPGVLDFGAMPA